MFRFILKFFGKSNPTRDSGIAGEKAAAKFLAKNGYKILERNWRYRRCEIDIIAQLGEIVVFAEVKTRRPGALVNGYYAAVSPRKLSKIREGARAYLKRISARTWRYDVIEVDCEGKDIVDIRHFANVGFRR